MHNCTQATGSKMRQCRAHVVNNHYDKKAGRCRHRILSQLCYLVVDNANAPVNRFLHCKNIFFKKIITLHYNVTLPGCLKK
jgi:hypothetical protein